jgi:hypothetical protein
MMIILSVSQLGASFQKNSVIIEMINFVCFIVEIKHPIILLFY